MAYGTRLMLIFSGLTALLVGCCLVFQFFREREFSAHLLDAQLQVLNTNILDHLDDGYTPDEWMPGLDLPLKNLRITILDKKSETVIYDNVKPGNIGMSYTKYKPEMKRILGDGRHGKGHAIREFKDLGKGKYFCSFTSNDNMVVRSGAPFDSLSVTKFMRGDKTFLYIMLGAMLLTIVAVYFVTRSIGRTITRLNAFARSAEAGERIYDTEDFPKDELGAISRHIVRLFARLQQATTERDRQQLMLMEEEENRQRIKRDLTNNINHELKTPIASVQVTVEALLEHPGLPEEKKRQLLTRCLANARRLASLLRDVSTITRMDEASSLIQRETVDLSPLITDVVSDAVPRAKDHGMDIKCALPRTMPMMGNVPLLESVFRNLVENAIAYSGATLITISILEARPEMFTIVVADNGIGIPEQHMARLFERFYRIDKGRSRSLGGTGLGLAIVKNAVQFHGGDVEARNRSTGGLEFIISLPRASYVEAWVERGKEVGAGDSPDGEEARKPEGEKSDYDKIRDMFGKERKNR